LSAKEQALARFTIADLFAEPDIRRRVILAFLVSLATTFAFWGISAWLPPYMAAAAAKAGLPAQQWASYAAMANNGAAIVGYIAFGFLADLYGRKSTTVAYIVLAFLSVPVVFLWTSDLGMILIAAAFSGAFVSGQYTWMAAWLPELFPTRVRATATAFVFNAPRLIAWTGPLISGWLIANFGGFSRAAVAIACIYIVGIVAALLLPETRGKPLPE
jgi:MFS family permease